MTLHKIDPATDPAIADLELSPNLANGASLPDPESMQIERVQKGPKCMKTLGRKRRIIVITLICILNAAIVAVAVIFARNMYRRRSSTARVESVETYLTTLLTKESASALQNDSASPQSLATQWMVKTDSTDIPKDYESVAARKFIERWALAVVYFSLDGPRWPLRHGFLNGRDACNWFSAVVVDSELRVRVGVYCNKEGLVSALVLFNNDLKGTIPPEIALFEKIRIIEMSHNLISGPIPTGLTKLNELSHVWLEYNEITGHIPSGLASLTDMATLQLSNNRISGSIPGTISQLTNLETLALDDNLMTGSLVNLFSMPSLSHVLLEDNEFTGHTDIEGFFEDSSNLKVLDLSDNKSLQGSFPSEMLDSTKFPSLIVLDLNGNNYGGTLPWAIKENNVLEYLALYDNSIGGGIADVPFSNLKALTHLDLSSNAFVGDLPFQFLGAMPDLTYLFLANNTFTEGPIPDDFQSLTQLRELSLKDTNRVGTIPTYLGSLDKLILLDLDRNKLTGSIPKELGQLANMRYLLLNRNYLNGTFPMEMESLTSLVLAYMEKNSITGDAGVICKNNDMTAVSDCAKGDNGTSPELTCDCCAKCCSDDDQETCNNEDLLANYNPIWEYGYERYYHDFTSGEIIHNFVLPLHRTLLSKHEILSSNTWQYDLATPAN